MCYGGTVAFLLIPERFPPSLTTRALRRVMQLSLSTSHALKGISLPCVDFSPAGACVLWTEGFVLMCSTLVREGKCQLVLTALISAQLKLPEESGAKQKHVSFPAWQSCPFFPLSAARPCRGAEPPRAASERCERAVPQPGVIHKRVRPVGRECLPCRSCAAAH